MKFTGLKSNMNTPIAIEKMLNVYFVAEFKLNETKQPIIIHTIMTIFSNFVNFIEQEALLDTSNSKIDVEEDFDVVVIESDTTSENIYTNMQLNARVKSALLAFKGRVGRFDSLGCIDAQLFYM